MLGRRFTPGRLAHLLLCVPILALVTSPANAEFGSNHTAVKGGLGPNIVLDQISPANVGNQLVGTGSAAFDITITNDGGQALSITGVTEMATPGCAQFIVPNLVDTVDPPPTMDSAILSITFFPTTRGASSCEFTIASNDPDMPDTFFTVNGNGVGSELAVSSGTLAFGDQRINSPSAAQMFTLSNIGDAGFSLNVSSVTIPAVDNDEDYLISGFLGGSIAPGSSETVGVIFQPVDAGPQNATINIASDADVNATGTKDCTGHGTVALVSLMPDPLNWPPVVVRDAVTQGVQILNSGDADLTVDDLTVTGSNPSTFNITSAKPPPSFVVAPSSSTTVDIACSPNGVGTRTADLTVSSDADNLTLAQSTLRCTGVKPDIVIMPAAGTTIEFAGIIVDSTSGFHFVTISNDDQSTTSTLSVSEVTITGIHASDFTHGASDPYSIAPGESVDFDVSFSPTALGAHTATLNIVSDDQETPMVQLTLSGSGLRSESVLLVDDDDDAPDVAMTYAGNLSAIHIGATEVEADGDASEPDAASMSPFDVVLWVTGSASDAVTGPSAISEIEIGQYLDAGGCFVISSPGWFSVRGSTFLMAEMGVATGISDVGQSLVSGLSPYFLGLGPYAIAAPMADRLDPTFDADTAFDGDAGPAAIQRVSTAAKMLYFGFDLTALPTMPDEQDVLNAVMTFCTDPLFRDGFENAG